MSLDIALTPDAADSNTSACPPSEKQLPFKPSDSGACSTTDKHCTQHSYCITFLETLGPLNQVFTIEQIDR
ncbi:hypothetical protein FA95DRAFT_1560136 [Auriscalpium vulgare]|uniref:Uncharacterized protein n=1 Tax=Auriscalpium vulgare TaxID=40419 RepID=A0ACB8RRB8_9AGAM|nr:hypothetical protein FA95DRAFT_1560136 [Auriscalpium vulgare]